MTIQPVVLTCQVMSEHQNPAKAPRRRRSDGIRSREAILRQAASLATVEGIEGLSLGRLADAVGMSKSGLFAHFRSKEELQLATIETADAIFEAEVVEPALQAPPGIPRLRALAEGFLAHLERGVFPGGCFFASVAAEIDTHPGPVRDRALASNAAWFGRLEAAVTEAQADATVDEGEDPAQLAFELQAYLLLANASYVASGDPIALDRARGAIDRLLQSVAPKS
jgi:AcrR family transcriptional regulator